MSLDRLAIIGAGAISEIVVATLSDRLIAPLECISVLVPPEFSARAAAMLDKAGSALAKRRSVHNDLDALLADRPTVVAECASHGAVKEYGPEILRRGIDLIIISIGALADERLRTSLQDAAGAGRSRVVLPSGAIGGVDILSAARFAGLESVTYRGCKPPGAWRGTPAERVLDLDGLRQPTVFFEGNAGQAAREYPLNANVVAALALAGIGFEQTSVRLIADPGAAHNTHEFIVRATCGTFTIKIEGRPSAANPRTSAIAGYSVARELLNYAGPIAI